MAIDIISAGIALLLLRLVIGQIFILHGWKKIAKQEADGTPKYQFLGVVEVLAGISLVLGLWHQLAAGIFMIIMGGAVYTKLFVWPDQKYAGNIEYDVLIFLASLTIFALGPGMWILM